MAHIEDRLVELARPLPAVTAPLAAYVPAVRSGNLVFTSGQLPMVDGTLHAAGLVSADQSDGVADGWVIDSGVVTVDVARECAALCALNALAAVRTLVDLDDIVRIVKVVGYVASAPGFVGQPQVINGASELLGAIWGDAAAHARSAVGVASLPLNAPVEVELVVEVAG